MVFLLINLKKFTTAYSYLYSPVYFQVLSWYLKFLLQQHFISSSMTNSRRFGSIVFRHLFFIILANKYLRMEKQKVYSLKPVSYVRFAAHTLAIIFIDVITIYKIIYKNMFKNHINIFWIDITRFDDITRWFDIGGKGSSL